MNEIRTETRAPAATGRTDIRKLAILAMLAAVAYVVMVVGRVPIVLWYKYDPKDIIIAIAGFMYGPLPALGISLVVSFVEMITVSSTGPWGLVMNVVSTCTFVCPAAWMYKRRHTQKGAITGLAVGVAVMTVVMLLWNYLIIPLYTPYIARADVAPMLLSVILPFNLIKAGLNATLTIIIYKPVVKALRRARLLDSSTSAQSAGGGGRAIVLIGAVVLLITCILCALLLGGKI